MHVAALCLGKVRTRGARLECRADQSDGRRQIAEDELRADADHAEARATQLEIPARIRPWLACVNGAIHFHDQPDAGSKEISDEAADERHLAAKRDAELASVDGGSKPRFRLGEPAAMLASEARAELAI